MQPGAPGQPGGWGPQGGAPQAGYGQAPAPGGYGQAPAPGGYGQQPAPGAPYQPPQQPAGGGGGFQMPGGMSAAALQKGFVGSMFDFSFNNFVTPKIVKFLYGLWLLISVLVVLGLILSGVAQMFDKYGSVVMGILMILLAPIAGILYMIIGRVYFEVLIVLFKIVENLGELNRKTKE